MPQTTDNTMPYAFNKRLAAYNANGVLENNPLGNSVGSNVGNTAGSFLSNLGSSLLGGLPGIASGALGIVGNIFQNRANKKLMREYNRAQMELAQQSHQWNLEMLQNEQDFSERMWNMQNEYNSPEAQVQRYKDAGLNPYLMMSPGDAGIAQSASTPSGNPTAAPQIQPFQYQGVGESIQNAVATAFNAASLGMQADYQRAQINSMSIDNELKAQELAFRQRELDFFNDTYKSRKDKAFEEYELLRLGNQKSAVELPYTGRRVAAATVSEEQSAFLSELMVTSQRLENRLKEINVEFLPTQLQENIALIIAQAKAAMSSANLTATQAAQVAQQTIIDMAERDDRAAINKLLQEDQWLENEFNVASFPNRVVGTLPPGVMGSGLNFGSIAAAFLQPFGDKKPDDLRGRFSNWRKSFYDNLNKVRNKK